MNHTEAATFLAAEGAYAKRITRMTAATLRAELIADMRDRGQTSLTGFRQYSKDELIGELCRMHYPPLKRNEAIHVQAHDVPWPDCEFCTGPKPCVNCRATATEQCADWCGAAGVRLQPAVAP
jgi:hypothetical protein